MDEAAFCKATAHDAQNVLPVVSHLQSLIGDRIPDVAVICGSGLSNLHEMLTNRLTVPYASIPGFPLSTVQGQVGELVFGELGSTFVVLMRGRFHFYEGYEPKLVALPVRVFAALGVRALVVTNASGGVNRNFRICDIMIIQDHLSFPCLAGSGSPLMGENDPRFGPRFPAVSAAYDTRLQAVAEQAAERLKVTHRLRRGVYVGVAGPSYETPAEIGALRVLGGDAVGMSTVCVVGQFFFFVIGWPVCLLIALC